MVREEASENKTSCQSDGSSPWYDDEDYQTSAHTQLQSLGSYT